MTNKTIKIAAIVAIVTALVATVGYIISKSGTPKHTPQSGQSIGEVSNVRTGVDDNEGVADSKLGNWSSAPWSSDSKTPSETRATSGSADTSGRPSASLKDSLHGLSERMKKLSDVEKSDPAVLAKLLDELRSITGSNQLEGVNLDVLSANLRQVDKIMKELKTVEKTMKGMNLENPSAKDFEKLKQLNTEPMMEAARAISASTAMISQTTTSKK